MTDIFQIDYEQMKQITAMFKAAAVILGDKRKFAIEWEVEAISDTGTILGKYCFWSNQQRIGDWDDTVSLSACPAWCETFLSRPNDRYESDLFDMSKEQVLTVIYDDFFGQGIERYPDVYHRFILQELGMSSFDKIDLTILEDGKTQRLIWRGVPDLVVYESVFPDATIQSVMRDFVQSIQQHR